MSALAASGADWPAPIDVLNEEGASDIVLICEHASNHIPSSFDGLGLSPLDLERHIAWDIGAEAVTRNLSKSLDAVAFLGTYSRLLIDLNRPLDSATSIPQRSEATDVPGNIAITETDRETRIARIFEPFQARIAAHLDARSRNGRETIIVAVHSFTPVFLGEVRPWHVGILYEKSKAFGEGLIIGLASDPQLFIGANVPYVIDRAGDFAIPVHGEDRGHSAVLVEIRHDLIGTAEGVAIWAAKLAAALTAQLKATKQDLPLARP